MQAKKFRKSIGSYISSFPCERYLVVGASPLQITKEILREDKKVTMIDIRPDKLSKVARNEIGSKVSLVLVEEGGEFARFSDGSFDCVVFYDVLHHFPDKERVIAETKRILTDDGYAFFSEPNISSKWRREYDQFGELKNSIYKRTFISLLKSIMFDVRIHTLTDFVDVRAYENIMIRHLKERFQKTSIDPLFRIYVMAQNNGLITSMKNNTKPHFKR
jgi:2-polyprenyl-3-methyl-5-hydroxy-6-metoxy-1,4-benzoquinol methylase